MAAFLSDGFPTGFRQPGCPGASFNRKNDTPVRNISDTPDGFRQPPLEVWCSDLATYRGYDSLLQILCNLDDLLIPHNMARSYLSPLSLVVIHVCIYKKHLSLSLYLSSLSLSLTSDIRSRFLTLGFVAIQAALRELYLDNLPSVV